MSRRPKLCMESKVNLIERFTLTFLNFIFTIPELVFHDLSLAPQKKYISAKKYRNKNSREL
jgi:hypothetical protein